MSKTFYQITKSEKHTINNKTDKIWKQSGTTYYFGCKDYAHNFRPEKVKATNKVLREKCHCVVCRSNKSRFLKQKRKCNRNEIVYFNSFGAEHVPEEIKEFIGKKPIKANIFWVQANDSVMCGYFCIEFIDFMLDDKKLTEYTSLFSPYDFKKNDNIILSYFKNE